MESKIYEIALGMLPGIGGHLSKTLVSYCGSAKAVFHTSRGKLQKIPGIGESLSRAITENKHLLNEAEQQATMADKLHVKVLFYTDPDYPNRLRQIHDAPALLFYKGTADLNTIKIAAVVGTRRATSYGKAITARIIEELNVYRPLILSGLAYGIDATAHKHALQCGLSTVGAMATGIDIIYPSSHRELTGKMLNQGGILTEYHFGSQPEPSRFPARNRIIAGLCDVLIVVEAAKTGGALITAEIANSYNREVFAVPGNLNQKYSEGCNNLIRNHKAHIYTGLSGFEYIMNWEQQLAHVNKSKPMEIPGLQEDEKCIVNIIAQSEAPRIDDISWKSQIPLSRLASILLTLEIRGIVKSLPGKKFSLSIGN